MGGKSYFCDYCCCYMKDDLNVRKKHNAGLAHTIAKVSYMRQYEDPRKLLHEESLKRPCTRYFRGYCKFDLYCQFGHFSEEQLTQLRHIVYTMNERSEMLAEQPSRRKKKRTKKLPPSMQPIDVTKLKERQFHNSWG